MSNFTRLIRFASSTGSIHYAEAPSGALSQSDFIGAVVKPYVSNPLTTDSSVPFSETEETIAEVLSPLESVPIFYGIGLNYRKHAEESNFPIPGYPMVFTKPSDALAGPYEDIPITAELECMDYEGELSVVIGRDAKNLPASANPLDYVLGYMASNDVSSRFWQMPERSGGQHGYAKSFDKFAPVGPVLVSAAAIPDPSALTLKTIVNGEERQNTGLDDLIFGVGEIIRHLSRGTTLRRGTVIMTGTPSGVAAFMKPPKWLGDGDVVEVEISGIGRIRNKILVR